MERNLNGHNNSIDQFNYLSIAVGVQVVWPSNTINKYYTLLQERLCAKYVMKPIAICIFQQLKLLSKRAGSFNIT